MNPSFRVFDPPTGTTKVYVVNSGRMWEKQTILGDSLRERPTPPVAIAATQKGFNTRSGRPSTSAGRVSGRISSRSLKESRKFAKTMLQMSPFFMKKHNPFPLHNSASTGRIGTDAEWATLRIKNKGLPAVDPVNLGRESPIRNMEGKEKGFEHKPTIRFSATGTPVLEVSTVHGSSIVVGQQLLSGRWSIWTG